MNWPHQNVKFGFRIKDLRRAHKFVMGKWIHKKRVSQGWEGKFNLLTEELKLYHWPVSVATHGSFFSCNNTLVARCNQTKSRKQVMEPEHKTWFITFGRPELLSRSITAYRVPRCSWQHGNRVTAPLKFFHTLWKKYILLWPKSLFAFCREDVSVYLLTVFDTWGSPPAHRPGAPTVVGGQIPVGSVCACVCVVVKVNIFLVKLCWVNKRSSEPQVSDMRRDSAGDNEGKF